MEPQNEMDLIAEMVNQSIASLDSNLSSEEKEKYRDIFIKIFKEGKNPAEVLGFNKEMLEHMYAYGFRLYNLGNYKKAANVFLGLTMLNPDDPRITMAAGAAYHKLKNNVKAVEYYYLSSQQDPENPMPHFYMYDCFIQENFWGDAAFCLEEVIKRCADYPECAELKARCQLLLEPLKAKIAEHEAKLQKQEEIA